MQWATLTPSALNGKEKDCRNPYCFSKYHKMLDKTYKTYKDWLIELKQHIREARIISLIRELNEQVV